jgi:hypothetical protein
MAVVRTTGAVNVSSDVAMVSGTALTVAGLPGSPTSIRVKSISYGVIATAAGVTNGAISLRDGTEVLWKGYTYFTAANAGESQTKVFEIEAEYTPTTSLNLLHTNIIPATASACAAVIWS